MVSIRVVDMVYNCKAFEDVKVIGKKWSFVIIEELAIGERYGFNKLFLRLKKISPKVLSNRLKELESRGIIEKSSVGYNKLPKNLYKLTEKGRNIYEMLNLMKRLNCADNQIECYKKRCVDCEIY